MTSEVTSSVKEATCSPKYWLTRLLSQLSSPSLVSSRSSPTQRANRKYNSLIEKIFYIKLFWKRGILRVNRFLKLKKYIYCIYFVCIIYIHHVEPRCGFNALTTAALALNNVILEESCQIPHIKIQRLEPFPSNYLLAASEIHLIFFETDWNKFWTPLT